jgi:nicotinate (nicotinamide) nucleotide adenylyltransferase
MTEAGAGVLGLLGGTFDPLHVGHLRLALEAREALGLSALCLIPAGSPPLRALPHCAATQRLGMVERALAGMPGFSVDSGEVLAATDGAAPSYTVATLERLRRQHGAQRPLVLLLGADAFARLESWQRWRELFGLAHIAVATRPGHDIKSRRRRYGARWGVSRPPRGRRRPRRRPGRPHRPLRHHRTGDFRHGDPRAPGARSFGALSGSRSRSRLY